VTGPIRLVAQRGAVYSGSVECSSRWRGLSTYWLGASRQCCAFRSVSNRKNSERMRRLKLLLALSTVVAVSLVGGVAGATAAAL
jgi:hypothetical protein